MSADICGRDGAVRCGALTSSIFLDWAFFGTFSMYVVSGPYFGDLHKESKTR